VFTFTGHVESFTYFNYPLTLNEPADRVIIAAMSSNPELLQWAESGSFIELDELAFENSETLIPNAGFENWTKKTFSTHRSEFVKH
jgi:hypothetical protein